MKAYPLVWNNPEKYAGTRTDSPISVARSFIPGIRAAVDNTMEQTFMHHAPGPGEQALQAN